MNDASNSVSPVECVFFVLSEPAMSIMFSLDRFTFSRLSNLDRCSTMTVKITWERELFLLSLCSQTVRLISPWNISCSAASSHVTSCIVAPLAITP